MPSNFISEIDNHSSQTTSLNSNLSDSYLILLEGGLGGEIGKKSYKPTITLLKTNQLTDSFVNPEMMDFTYFSRSEIKNENDCGYALSIENDSLNRSSVTIGHYKTFKNENPMVETNLIEYSNRYTGGISSLTPISNNGLVGDFVLRSIDPITGVLDTGLNLNKYYLELVDIAGDYSNARGKCFLEKTINEANLTSLFNFYVIDLDLQTGYSSYTTSSFIVNANLVGVGHTINCASPHNFRHGDNVVVAHPDDLYSLDFIVDSFTPNSITLTNIQNSNKINFPNGTNFVEFPAGCSVSLKNDDGFIFSTTTTAELDASLNNYFSEFSQNKGLNIQISKKQTSSTLEISNDLTVKRDHIFGTNLPNINMLVERVENKDYLTTQYGSDPIKNQIKNKPKFMLLFNGFVKQNNIWNYYIGNQNGVYKIMQLLNFYLPSSFKILLGNSIKPLTSGNRCYHSIKLYEVNTYTNLASNKDNSEKNIQNAIRIILDSLIDKYKEKLFFSSSVEFLTTDLYYSEVDRINIFGKIKQTTL